MWLPRPFLSFPCSVILRRDCCSDFVQHRDKTAWAPAFAPLVGQSLWDLKALNSLLDVPFDITKPVAIPAVLSQDTSSASRMWKKAASSQQVFVIKTKFKLDHDDHKTFPPELAGSKNRQALHEETEKQRALASMAKTVNGLAGLRSTVSLSLLVQFLANHVF